jgi:hypothetical protein
MLLQEIAEQSKVLLIKEKCEVKKRKRIMNLFSRLRKSDGEVRFKHNNKSILINPFRSLAIVSFPINHSHLPMAECGFSLSKPEYNS